jgi:hypothetical protein
MWTAEHYETLSTLSMFSHVQMVMSCPIGKQQPNHSTEHLELLSLRVYWCGRLRSAAGCWPDCGSRPQPQIDFLLPPLSSLFHFSLSLLLQFGGVPICEHSILQFTTFGTADFLCTRRSTRTLYIPCIEAMADDRKLDTHL